MTQLTDQTAVASKLEDYTLLEEDLIQVTGGEVKDSQGTLIGGLVGAKVLGFHNMLGGYKEGARAALPFLNAKAAPEILKAGGGKGAALAGGIGLVEGGAGGALLGGLGTHEVNYFMGSKKK